MLSLLLDEHLSPKIARQLAARNPEIRCVGLPHWENGAYREASDDLVLVTAYQQGLTLVTYDQRTIVPLLKTWGEQGVSHGGVIFVDQRTLAPNDIGGLVRALSQLWDVQHLLDWADRVVYLTR